MGGLRLNAVAQTLNTLSGVLTLEGKLVEADKASRERWLAVLEQLKVGAMPPKGKPRPPEKDVRALSDWISGGVVAADAARRTSGDTEDAERAAVPPPRLRISA